MKKFFTQILAASMLLLGFSLQAQDVLFEEQFDGGMGDWTINTLANSDVDSLEWTWTPNGNSGAGGPILASPTASNGAMYVNFFYMRYGGIAANIPSTFPYGEYVGELISPTFDVSGATEPLSITYYSAARLLNESDNSLPHTSISFSTDDGATWLAALDANEGMVVNDDRFNGMRTVNIPASFGLQGSSTVKVKFTYNQDFYYWTIDDIAVVTRPEVSNIQANDNFFAIPPNYSTPKSQVDEFGFLVDIENVGGVVEENVNLNVRIQNSATGTVVYEDDLAYGSIAIDSLAENQYFGSFTPDPVEASYLGTYTVSSDGNDVDVSNNTLSFPFEISKNLFAKENEVTRDVRPSDDASFGYGNVFYVPTAGHFAKEVTFGVANASDVVNGFVTIKLLEWQGDVNQDGMATADDQEYTVASFSGYTFSGTEDNMLITAPVDLDNKLIPLKANTHYVAVIEYTDVTSTPLFFLANAAVNYGAMRLRSDSIGNPRYSSLLDVGADGEYSIIGFGNDIVPVVRLGITDRDPSTDVTELSEENIVNVYPNPTADVLNINLELVEMTKALNVKIVDVAGKVHFQQLYENIQMTTLEYDLRNYTSGSYMVHLETEEGTKTIPFVVQK